MINTVDIGDPIEVGSFVETGERLVGVSGIYSIQHRETGKIYIGSSCNVGTRKNAHIQSARRGIVKTPLHVAIRKHGASAFDFQLIERCHRDMNALREDFWIRFFNSASLNGFNVASSAYHCPGHEFPESTRKRISDAKKGSKASEITRAKMSAARKGRSMPPRSPEHIAKISAALRGRKRNPESVAKTANWHRGRKRPIETGERIRASKLGKKRPKIRNLINCETISTL